MKNTMRKAMLSTIAMLVVAVMSLTGVTYAWFTAGQQATVKGMTAKVTAADGGVQVRLKDTATWMTELDLGIAAKDYGVINPVSSADGKNFFILGDKNPADANQAKVVGVTYNGADTDVNADQKYDIIVRDIQLSNPGQSEITVDLEGSSIVKNATAGVDNNIYKAVRVALIATGADTKSYVYAAETDTWFAFKATSTDYVTLGTAKENVAVSTTTSAVDACTIVLPANPDNATASKIVDVKVVIWLEGQDTDCKNANAAGAFDITLNFKNVAAE